LVFTDFLLDVQHKKEIVCEDSFRLLCP